MIRYLKHHQIDKRLWDDAINVSWNGLVYVQCWFLDIVTKGWEALIEDDYESVMPLPAKWKFVLPYLIQPRFTQQLGIFSKDPLSVEKVRSFLNAVPPKFIWKDFNLNSQNRVLTDKRVSKRVNYELYLDKGYPEIFSGYNENTHRNLSKAKKNGIIIEKPLLPDDFLAYYSQFAKVKPDVTTYFQFKKIVEYALIHNLGEILLAYNSSNYLVGGAFFLVALNRVIYLASFLCDEGKESAAMFMVIDSMIQKYAGKPMVFDFEGSMEPGIARFFSGFGASPVNYYRYRDAIYRK